MSAFANWCLLKGATSLPAVPAIVAEFVREIAPLGIDRVCAAVDEISAAHRDIGLADPTAGNPVASAVSEVGGIVCPRWPGDKLALFKALPYALQIYLKERDDDRERVMKLAQNEAAEARKVAGLPKLPKHYYRKAKHGDQPNPAA